MKYKLLFVVLLIINNSLFGLSEHIELYQVMNNTGSDIQLDLEFNQILEFRFNRSDFEIIDQAGLKYPNSVRKLIKENIINHSCPK